MNIDTLNLLESTMECIRKLEEAVLQLQLKNPPPGQIVIDGRLPPKERYAAALAQMADNPLDKPAQEG